MLLDFYNWLLGRLGPGRQTGVVKAAEVEMVPEPVVVPPQPIDPADLVLTNAWHYQVPAQIEAGTDTTPNWHGL